MVCVLVPVYDAFAHSKNFPLKIVTVNSSAQFCSHSTEHTTLLDACNFGWQTLKTFVDLSLYPMHNLSLICDPFSHGQNKPYNPPKLSFGPKGTSLCSASIYYTKFSLFPVQLRADSRPCVQIPPLKIVSILNVPLPKFGHPLTSLSLSLSHVSCESGLIHLEQHPVASSGCLEYVPRC